jgi:hypothetical protein
MAYLNFDPIEGEEVGALGHSGHFRIEKVYPSGHIAPPSLQNSTAGITTLGTVDLRLLGINHDFFLREVPWSTLLFDEARPIRRALEWMKEEKPFPRYILDYTVESRNDHEGNPAFFIRFFVEPDDQPSVQSIKELNQFLGYVETTLLSLSLNRYPYVQVSERQKLLDVAS